MASKRERMKVKEAIPFRKDQLTELRSWHPMYFDIFELLCNHIIKIIEIIGKQYLKIQYSKSKCRVTLVTKVV